MSYAAHPCISRTSRPNSPEPPSSSTRPEQSPPAFSTPSGAASSRPINIQALSDHIPGLKLLAYLSTLSLVAAGAAILWRRTARTDDLALAAIYISFALFWLHRSAPSSDIASTHMFQSRQTRWVALSSENRRRTR